MTPDCGNRVATVAGPLSPSWPCDPIPAKVMMIPEQFTMRTTLLLVTGMHIFPEESNATAKGKLSFEFVACQLSLAFPPTLDTGSVYLLPATVVTKLVAASTLR